MIKTNRYLYKVLRNIKVAIAEDVSSTVRTGTQFGKSVGVTSLIVMVTTIGTLMYQGEVRKLLVPSVDASETSSKNKDGKKNHKPDKPHPTDPHNRGGNCDKTNDKTEKYCKSKNKVTFRANRLTDPDGVDDIDKVVFKYSRDGDKWEKCETKDIHHKQMYATCTKKLKNGNYKWKVRSIDKQGEESDYSVTNKFRLDTTPPETPKLEKLKEDKL